MRMFVVVAAGAAGGGARALLIDMPSLRVRTTVSSPERSSPPASSSGKARVMLDIEETTARPLRCASSCWRHLSHAEASSAEAGRSSHTRPGVWMLMPRCFSRSTAFTSVAVVRSIAPLNLRVQ